MLIFSVGAIFLVVIIVVAYIAIYNYIINQRLRNNITDGRKWPAPHGMLKAALILVLVISCILFIMNERQKQNVVEYSNNMNSYHCYNKEDLKDTYAETYYDAVQEGQLPGYEKYEDTKDDFHYVYFTSKSEFDFYHPSFVLFVEYIGKEKIVTDNCSGQFIKSDYTGEGCGAGMSGGKIETVGTYLVIGNNNYEGEFQFTLCLYTDDKMLNPDMEIEESRKYAAASIKIDIPLNGKRYTKIDDIEE